MRHEVPRQMTGIPSLALARKGTPALPVQSAPVVVADGQSRQGIMP